MREYKFKGQRLDNDQWIKGSLIIDNTSDKYFISLSVNESDKVGQEGCLYIVSCEVNPETIGQFTGICDKNGKEIYEGDIYYQGDKNIKYIVVWHDTGLIGKQIGSSSYAGLTYWQDEIEVGNEKNI